MRECKYTNYDALPVMLTAPEMGEVLGISRAAAPSQRFLPQLGEPFERLVFAEKVPSFRSFFKYELVAG